jgi:hypothetical protein
MADESKPSPPAGPTAAQPQRGEPKVQPDPKESAADPAVLRQAMDLVGRMMAQNALAATQPTARREGADEAEPGGHFVVDGEHVNAWGEKYKEGRDGSFDNPELPRLGR